MSSAHARRAVLLVLAATYFAYVFRLPSGVWLRMGLGDWIDPYFINSLLEQWRFTLTHLQNPASPPVFFPARGTLGYSHSLVFYAPVYVVARIWLHPFTAYTVTLLAVIAFGTVCLYGVFRRFVGLTFAESLIFTALFATSGNVISGSTGVWSQRASIFLVPPILLLGLASARRPRGALRWTGLASTGFLAALLLTHDVYTGLLTGIVAALLAIGARAILGWPRSGLRIVLWRVNPAAMSGWRRPAAISAATVVALSLAIALQHEFGNVRHRHPERALAVAAVAAIAFELLRGGVRERIGVADRSAAMDSAALTAGAVAGLAVFARTYGEAYSQHPGFPMQEMLEHLMPVEASAWRHLLTAPGGVVAFDAGRSVAIVFGLAAAAWLPWLRVAPRVRMLTLWFVLVTLVALAAPVRIGDFAVWKYATDRLPGFAAIRDPQRIEYPFELAAALASGLFIAQLTRASASRRMLTAIVLAIVIVKWNPGRFDYERPREIFDRWIEAPVQIDRACGSFFIKRGSPEYMARSPHMWALYSNDAAFIATKYGVPTLNGYSAWTPPDWHLFNPQDADYMPGVAKWISLNRLDRVCALDIDRRTMTPF